MNRKIYFISVLSFLLCVYSLISFSQTKIAKEQIEEAFLLKSGGDVYGDITSATSFIKAASFALVLDSGVFEITQDGSIVVLRSNHDIKIDPTNNGTAGAVIVPATVMEFPDFTGDKIRFFSHSYKIGVSPFNLDITSDKNIKFHSDTSEDLMTILGDQGDVHVKQDIYSGHDFKAANVYAFSDDSTGNKILFYGTLYRIAISESSLDFYSDQYFKWHSDTMSDAMILDAENGILSIKGPIQLNLFDALPNGEIGQLIYFDHPSDDNQDGAYIYTSAGWQKL